MKSSIKKTVIILSMLGLVLGSNIVYGNDETEEQASCKGSAQSQSLEDEMADMLVNNQVTLGKVLIKNCSYPVRRIFNYSEGTLSSSKYSNDIKASYIGEDHMTGDSLVVNMSENGDLQLILDICKTGDASVDDILLNKTPTIVEAFRFDKNVPNGVACPGRIIHGRISFGTISTGYGNIPVQSGFQPPAECY